MSSSPQGACRMRDPASSSSSACAKPVAVVAVAVEHVEVDQVHEEQPAVHRAQRLEGQPHSVGVPFAVQRLVHAAPARRCRRSSRCRRPARPRRSAIQQGVLGGRRSASRGGRRCAGTCPASPRRAARSPGRCGKRSTQRAGLGADAVELGHRDDVLRGRRSAAPSRPRCRQSARRCARCSGPSSSMMAVPEAGLLPMNRAAGEAARGAGDLGREAVRERSGRPGSVTTPAISQCPVMVSLPAEDSRIDPHRARGVRVTGGTPRMRGDVAEAQGAQVGQDQPTDPPRQVAEGVGARVAICRRRRRRHRSRRHRPPGSPCVFDGLPPRL